MESFHAADEAELRLVKKVQTRDFAAIRPFPMAAVASPQWGF